MPLDPKALDRWITAIPEDDVDPFLDFTSCHECLDVGEIEVVTVVDGRDHSTSAPCPACGDPA